MARRLWNASPIHCHWNLLWQINAFPFEIVVTHVINIEFTFGELNFETQTFWQLLAIFLDDRMAVRSHDHYGHMTKYSPNLIVFNTFNFSPATHDVLKPVCHTTSLDGTIVDEVDTRDERLADMKQK